jgi:mannose-6-phosphate isomerase
MKGQDGMTLYPLLFKSVYKERVWGGRKLEEYGSGFEVPSGNIGEAWIVADHPHGESLIINGELKGKTLQELIKEYGSVIFGTKIENSSSERFPLLIKLLDCNDDLSIQVHPTDVYRNLPPGELGKTEMWVVLDATPDAKIVFGLRENISRKDFEEAIAGDRIMECLLEVSVKAGDSFYIPSGTVHALGRGLLIAEIQQNSDTTYRVYDYNRSGLNGQLRELHLEDALNVIDFGGSKGRSKHIENIATNEWVHVCDSPYFVVEMGICKGTWQLKSNPKTFIILIAIKGSGKIIWHDSEVEILAGQAILIPAQMGGFIINGSIEMLKTYLP